MTKNLRLQTALAQLGFASRRKAAEIIKAARVKVNGKLILKPGQRVNLEKDLITVENRSSCVQKKVYFILNKPKGVVTTVRDRFAHRCVLDLIEQKNIRIYPVGRLDKDTRGLLLLTNDGELAYRLTHPRFGVKKIYRVCIKGNISREKIKRLEAGVFLEGKKTFPCKIKLIATRAQTTSLELQLTEGRKRQIKKMFLQSAHPVMDIRRIAFGSLKLMNLKSGRWRLLNTYEIVELKKLVGIL